MYKINVEENGCFSFEYAGIRLTGGYPGIDGRQIKPVAISVDRTHAPNYTEVEYQLGDRVLKQRYTSTGDNSLSIATSLTGFSVAPHWVLPFCGMTVEKADRFHKQGFGFGGPSGIYKINELIQGKTLESYLATGIIDENGNTMVMGVWENADFLHRTSLYVNTHRKGLCDQKADDSLILLDSGFSTENIDINGSSLKLPDIRIFFGENANDLFTSYAQALAAANGIGELKPPCYHYCSWYHKGPYFSMDDLNELLKGLNEIEPRIPLQSIQIDDGYCPASGDWLLPSPLFPDTLEKAFAEIEKAGYKPGVWVAPFMVGSRSEIAANHPDWLLKDINGDIHVEWKIYDGGMQNGAHCDEKTFVLDTSNPEAFEYLRKVFRTLRKWGAVMYKTDFMDWGFRDSVKYKRHTPGKTSAQYFMDVVRMIREEIGDESYWLACISPFAQFVGFADGMRIGNDILCSWKKGAAMHLLTETPADRYLNGILWQNDPDVTYVRDIVSELSYKETKAIAIWNAISGGSVNTSDPLHRVSGEALNLWRFLQPDVTHNTAYYPGWDLAEIKKTAVRKLPHRNAYAVYVINIEDYPQNIVLNMADLTGLKNVHVYEWEPGKSKYISGNTVVAQTDPHEGRLYYVSEDKIPPESNLSIGGVLAKGLPG